MDELQELLSSIGATAEMTVIFREGLRRQGVPDDEAMELTRAFLHEILSINRNKEDD